MSGHTAASRGRFVVALALASLLAFGVAAAGARPIPQNIDISRAHGNEAEHAIAVNPTNPQNIVAMSTLSDAPFGLLEAVSFDGGQSWTTRIIGDGDRLGKACCDEQLAFDRFGNLWMAYLRNHSKLVPIGLSALATYLLWRLGRRTVGETAAIVGAALWWLAPAAFVWASTLAVKELSRSRARAWEARNPPRAPRSAPTTRPQTSPRSRPGLTACG